MSRWRNSFPARQLRARPLACFAIAVLCGAILAHDCSISLPVSLGFGAALLIPTGICIVEHRRFAAWVMLLGVCLGASRMTASLERFTPVETRYSVDMVGRITTDPYTNPDTGRVIARFLPETVEGESSALRLRLYLRGDAEALEQIAYGQRLKLKGHIWANDPVTNPYEFDFGEYLHRNGMDVIATAKIEDVTILDTRRDIISVIIDIRHAIGRHIDALFPESAGIVRALVLGDRSMIGEELRQSLNATGTAHLIAISGLHVTALALALSAGLRLFMSRRRANLIVLGPLMFYGALIGFSAPFVRALTMFALFSFSQVLGLPSDPVTRLCAALLGYILVKPLAVTDGGFVLSFTASAGIILLLPPLRDLLHLDRLPRPSFRQPRLKRLAHRAIAFLPELLCASLAAQLATLPAVIAYFGVQSVVSLPYNLVCVPLCMLGYGMSLVTLAVSGFLLPLGRIIAIPADRILAVLILITRKSADLPLTSVRVGRYPALLLLLHAAVMLASSGLCLIKANRRRYFPAAIVAIAGLSSLITWLNCQPFRVTFLDADQADCAVLQTRGQVYVFDTGDTYTPAGDYLSATCLHVDGVFLSHPHQDHAGGLPDILDCFRPDAIYVPAGWFEQEPISDAVTEGIDRAEAMEIPIVELFAGDEISLSPDAKVTVYNPHGPFDSVNDMSLLLLAESGDRSVLFTGDLTSAGEPPIVPECEILKVAHHGADNATSSDFLEACTPDIAVIQVGENNHGHPSDLTLWKLSHFGAEILRNDELGAITLTADDKGWQIKTYLEAVHELE